MKKKPNNFWTKFGNSIYSGRAEFSELNLDMCVVVAITGSAVRN